MSTIDNGPSNHEDDLGRALRDLVDDASLPGLDAHLDVVRGRTRRRRAAKKVALGATTLCVAGALGVAALSIPQDVRPEPIAPAESPSPTATPSPVPTFPAGIADADLVCQQPAPTATGDDLPAHLRIDSPGLAVRTPGTVTAPVVMTFDDDARLRFDGSTPGAYVVTQGGVIVSSSLPATNSTDEATPEPGSSTTWDLAVTSVASCGTAQPAPLPPGDYEVLALHRLPLTGHSVLASDGTWGEETTGALFDGWLVSEPAPLTVVPEHEHEPEPIEVRDAFGGDTSAIFEGLRQAATTGTPAAIDLMDGGGLFVDGPDRITVTVARIDDTGKRPRAASDDGWRLELPDRGVFMETVGSSVFTQLVGTYSVTMDDPEGTPTFTLKAIPGGAAAAPPASTDTEVCVAFRDSLDNDASGVTKDVDDAIERLANDPAPAAESAIYAEIRARWIDSPRVWWAIQSSAFTNRVYSLGGDAIVSACADEWGG